MSGGVQRALRIQSPRYHRHQLKMGFGVAEFIYLLDLQASIFVGDNVRNGHSLGGHVSNRGLHRATTL